MLSFHIHFQSYSRILTLFCATFKPFPPLWPSTNLGATHKADLSPSFYMRIPRSSKLRGVFLPFPSKAIPNSSVPINHNLLTLKRQSRRRLRRQQKPSGMNSPYFSLPSPTLKRIFFYILSSLVSQRKRIHSLVFKTNLCPGSHPFPSITSYCSTS